MRQQRKDGWWPQRRRVSGTAWRQGAACPSAVCPPSLLAPCISCAPIPWRLPAAQPKAAMSFHIAETTVSFPLRAEEARKLGDALTAVMQTFAEKQKAERPKRWPALEYVFKGACVHACGADPAGLLLPSVVPHAWLHGPQARPLPSNPLYTHTHTPGCVQGTRRRRRLSIWRCFATPMATPPRLTPRRSSRCAPPTGCGSRPRAS